MAVNTGVLNAKQNKALRAIITTPTIKEAADVSGISERTIYRYINDPQFMTAYRSLKSEIMRGVTNKIQLSSTTAIDTLVDVMENSKSDIARVQAASKILDLTYQTYETEDLEARLDAIEKLASEQDEEDDDE